MSVWQPIETAPKDGSRILLWVCPRGSLRRGFHEICWRGEHRHWGEVWLRNEGKDIVGEGVATHWQALPDLPTERRDKNADPRPGDDLFPTVNWSPRLIVRIVVAGIASWMILGALGFAVFWALS